MKYLGVNLTKEVKICTLKIISLMKETEEDSKKIPMFMDWEN